MNTWDSFCLGGRAIEVLEIITPDQNLQQFGKIDYSVCRPTLRMVCLYAIYII